MKMKEEDKERVKPWDGQEAWEVGGEVAYIYDKMTRRDRKLGRRIRRCAGEQVSVAGKESKHVGRRMKSVTGGLVLPVGLGDQGEK